MRDLSDTWARPSKPQAYLALIYAIALFWINLYICRELFFVPVGAMNSMHGVWTAVAKWAGGSWLHSSWWPYWDGGIPFEFTYAPLVPALTAFISKLRGVPEILAFQSVTALVYAVGPVTLFLMAWRFTGYLGYSFLAALFYSLTAPTELLVPDSNYSLGHFWDARRFYLLAVWDDTPHVLALAIFPLVLLFLALSIRKRRTIYYAATAIFISLATFASPFGAVTIALGALCLLFTLRRKQWRSNTILTIAIGAYGYAISSPFLPPSLISAIHTAAPRGAGGQWTAGSWTALALVVLGWAILWRYLPRWTSDWTMQFFALFAYLTGSIPIIATYLDRSFIPQPNRYRFEMEFALALLIVFATRPLWKRLPISWRIALLFLFVARAGEQVVSHRAFAKNVLRPTDFSQTIESRVSTWSQQNLNGSRVMLPGSIGLWANMFTPVQQLGGESWSMAYNPMQQRALDSVYAAAEARDLDAQFSLYWLKAYGVAAVCVSGPKSPEFWRTFKHPDKFDGVLNVLWREEDTTIYQVPLRSTSFAHVLPQSAVVDRPPAGPGDLPQLKRLAAALDSEPLPAAQVQWEGSNRIHIQANANPNDVIFLQVSHHRGWRATAAGRKLDLHRDGLGLMWMQPKCNGPCTIDLEYTGGWELTICRVISSFAIAGLIVGLAVRSNVARALPRAKAES